MYIENNLTYKENTFFRIIKPKKGCKLLYPTYLAMHLPFINNVLAVRFHDGII